ncbi:MAG: MFS transporter [Thermodesulfobacteriota bacterium]|nr:MFS transporter [Thermodesulfobacteriota bacterium]
MKTVYYGWIIVGVGVLVKMAGLGFGRFAYPMLLPSMRESLRFNYFEMGLLSGGILAGYLLFSLIGGILATRFGSKRIVITSMLCGTISMFFISRLSEFIPLLFFTFAMGGAGGGAHISMTTLPMTWFERERLGGALGIVTGGTGFGIIITGLLLPYLLSTLGGEAWRECWIFMALLTLLVGLISFLLLKEKPSHKAPPLLQGDQRTALGPDRVKGSGLTLRAIFLIYFIFGLAYNIYVTYFVAFLVEEIRLTEGVAGAIWSIFGWMCVVSGWIWGFLSDRIGRREALVWNNGLISLSVLIPLLFHQTFLLGLSAFLFGATFLGTVTVIAACVGDEETEKSATLYGWVTLVHGIGQFLGTILGGYLRDLTGSFQLTLFVSLIGFVLCLGVTSLNKKG